MVEMRFARQMGPARRERARLTRRTPVTKESFNKKELRAQSIVTIPRLLILVGISLSLMYFGRYIVAIEYISLLLMVVISIWVVIATSVIMTIGYYIVDIRGYRIDTDPGKDRYMISKSPFSSIIIREFIK